MLAVYRLLLLVKFVGVLLFAGSAVALVVARDLEDRKVAVHRVGSPGLLITWGAGYALTEASGVPFTELWVLGAFALTFLAQGALTWSVSRPGRPVRGPATVAAACLLAVLALMIWKPQWVALVG